MPTLSDNKLWRCNVCGLEWQNQSLASSCERGHEVVYVKFKSSDLTDLIQFIYTTDKKYLSESLMNTLLKYGKRIKGA